MAYYTREQSRVYHGAVSERIIEGRVASSDSGKNLIDYLCGRFTYFGREQWLAQIADGRLLLNGAEAMPSQGLGAGDLLSFRPAPLVEPTVPLRYGLAYEDEDYLIANKPPLLPVHPSGIYFRNTLWTLLKQRLTDVHIITRLDKETSGLVLVAKNAAAARHAQEAQKTQSLEKRYLAAAYGAFPYGSLLAEGWLYPDDASPVRKKRRYGADFPATANTVHVIGSGSGDGSQATGGTRGSPPERCATGFRLMSSWQADEGPRSLIEARLLTGRTHQIRATLLSLGYPIVGDKLYGLDEGMFLRFIDDGLTEGDLKRLVLTYQALHCSLVSFTGADGRAVRAEAQPPWLQALGIGKTSLDTATLSGHMLRDGI